MLRDVFVGVLWALGVFLYFYKGYSWQENVALDIAGAAAVGVAVFPLDWPPDSGRTWVGTAHYGSAVLFFLAIAYVCIFRSGDTLGLLRDETARARFRRRYTALGVAMIAAPLGVVAVHLLSRAPERNPMVFFVEVAGIAVFSTFWLLKSRELALIERQPPVTPPASTSASDRRS